MSGNRAGAGTSRHRYARYAARAAGPTTAPNWPGTIDIVTHDL